MVRIKQRDMNKQQVRKKALYLTFDSCVIAVEKTLRIGGKLRIEQIRAV